MNTIELIHNYPIISSFVVFLIIETVVFTVIIKTTPNSDEDEYN
jgi:hypothetical protein